MEGSTGIGALGGKITGPGTGLGGRGRTGLGGLVGEITGVGVGLGLVGEVPVPAAPLSRAPPGFPAPETAPEIIAGGVTGPGMGLGAGGIGVGPGLVGEVSVSAPSLTGGPPSCLAMETAPEITAGGVSSVSDSLALVDSEVPSPVVLPVPIARTTSLGFSAVMVSLISVPVIALLAS